ncbi:MAG TPA: MGMT family protein [Candidatus Acidoferrum sp.]|nr:MGMT family protein [Candidatus Acidoferrum sp.]
MPRSRAGRTRPAGRGDASLVARLYDEFYAVVRRIPRGRVLTYGQVAELAGHPGAARAVGAAMRASTGRGLPWQRVVGAHARGLARVAILDPVAGSVQRALLEDEGVVFTPAGHIPLSRFGATAARESRRAAPGRRRRRRGRGQ